MSATSSVTGSETKSARSAALAVVFLGLGSVSVASGALGPLLVQIRASTHDLQFAQALVVMPFLGLGVAGLAAGWITERLGLPGVMRLAAATLALAGLIGFFGPPGLALLAAGFLGGASATLTKVGGAVILGQLYDGAARSRIVGYVYSFCGLLAVLAVVVSGLLADWLGWRYGFLELTFWGVLAFAAVLVGVRKPAPGAAASTGGPVRLSDLAPSAPYLAAIFLVMVLTGMSPTHIPLLLQAHGVHSAKTTSLVLSMQALFAMIGSFSYGPLTARLGRWNVAAGSVALLAIGLAIAATAQTWWLLGLCCAALGAANGVFLPYLLDGVYGRSPESVRSYAFGAFTTLSYLGAAAPAFVMRPIREAAGLQGLFGILLAATVVVGALFLARAASLGRRATANG